MRTTRTAESVVLGYRVERVEEYDATGMLCAMRHDVLCPQTGAVLATLESLRAAERYVLARELGEAA
ncbi:MAG TPA: hypothetical protein VFB32_17075 [Rudaea sp.]|nr:hypothetical protein [Rudaea sp.]